VAEVTKIDFILALGKRLQAMPKEEAEERIGFYTEMIEDRMEEGLSEQEAVAAVGDIDELAASILGSSCGASPKDQPPLMKDGGSEKNGRRSIALIVIGAPLWISIGAALFSVALALYVAVWSVVISLWATCGALIGTGVGGILYAVIKHDKMTFMVIGAALVCIGIAILLFLCCEILTKCVIRLTKRSFTAMLRGGRSK
jgi:uncharacterized membrane protein